MLARIRSDVRTALENDPAAESWITVLLTYAGLHAIWGHVIAHALWERGHRVIARLLSHLLRFFTGVEIHPGASVGDRVFIDHGMGTVIGETAEIGDDVLMYHGVTLGGKSSNPVKRHPTLEDGVTVGANATLIGDITVGENATVGAGAVVVDDIPAGETVAGVPAVPLESDGGAVDDEAVHRSTAIDRTVVTADPAADRVDSDADEKRSGEENPSETGPVDGSNDDGTCQA